jgi:hypothetical protein
LIGSSISTLRCRWRSSSGPAARGDFAALRHEDVQQLDHAGWEASPVFTRYARNRAMDDTPITWRKYTDLDEMKADEYRYWQSRPAHERFDAVEEMIETAYALMGWKIEPEVPRLQRPFVRLPIPWR